MYQSIEHAVKSSFPSFSFLLSYNWSLVFNISDPTAPEVSRNPPRQLQQIS